jgi:hypothetical protein
MHGRTETPWCTPTYGGRAVIFKEVLAQVLEWLQHDQRISYRALKRHFALDNDALEDLKEALLYAYAQVIVDDGRGLIWTGSVPRLETDARRGAEAESQFHTLLLAVMGLLQRERRVTYRRLKYIFRIDQRLLAWIFHKQGL